MNQNFDQLNLSELVDFRIRRNIGVVSKTKAILFILLLAGPFFESFSQTQNIENFTYKVTGNNVEVIYDLTGEVNEEYNIELYSSNDNFSIPLKEVTGDVGKGMKSGRNKQIVWASKIELGAFKGRISLKLKSSPISAPEFTYPADGSLLRRGKNHELTLTGTNGRKNLRFELYKGQYKVKNLTTLAMNSNYSWDIASDLQPGKDYSIKTRADGKIITSANFQIAPKFPLMLKVVPFFIVGGIVAILGSSGSSTTPPQTINNDIADPFSPE